LDGYEIGSIKVKQLIGVLLLAIPISSCGKVVATTQTSATSTDVPVVEYPSWGVPTDQPPLFFYASDIPQRTRDRVEETLYPNLNRLGWVGSFKLSFGMSSAQFQSEFLNFMKLTTDEQSKIL